MRFTNNISLAASLLPLLQLSQAVPTAAGAPADSNDLVGALKIDFHVKRNEDLDSLVKRDDEEGVKMTLYNRQILYISELKIGSNEDKVLVHVDTGSSDLWIPASDVVCTKDNPFASLFGSGDGDDGDDGGSQKRDESSSSSSPSFTSVPPHESAPPLGESGSNSTSSSNSSSSSDSDSEGFQCTNNGTFNIHESETFHSNDSFPFFTMYGDMTFAMGTWGYDTIKIGNTSVYNASFAIANMTSNDIGVFGIGLPQLEMLTRYGHTYENMPYKLKSQGLIKKALYSLYLDQEDASTGFVLFGAIDHAKHSGELETLPVQKGSDGEYSELAVEVKNLTLEHNGKTIQISHNSSTANLDSGSALSQLQPDQFKALGEALGEYDESQSAYKVDCDLFNSNSTFDIGFGDSVLRVPVSKLVARLDATTCYLGVTERQDLGGNGTASSLFGDNILRSAYLVYNLEDLEISIAQAKYTDEEDIQVVGGDSSSGGASNSTTGANSSTTGANSSTGGASNGTSGGSSGGASQANSGVSSYNLSLLSVVAALAIPFSLL